MAFDACMARLQRHLAADVAARSAVENRMTAARLKHDQLVARARVTLELRMASVPRVRAVVRADLGAARLARRSAAPKAASRCLSCRVPSRSRCSAAPKPRSTERASATVHTPLLFGLLERL
jgi:hypothetical protein